MINKTALPVYNIAAETSEQWVWSRYVSHGAQRCDILIGQYTAHLIESASLEYRCNHHFRCYMTNTTEGAERLRRFFLCKLAKLPQPQQKTTFFDQIVKLMSWS